MRSIVRTHIDDLAPVRVTPLILETALSSARSHDLRATCHRLDPPPTTLDTLAIGAGSAKSVVQGIRRVAFLNVAAVV